MNELTTTYEDRYRQLGYLFYSVASCDRSIIQSEIDALKRMVHEHWRNEDPGYDELGIESVRYIELHFDRALEDRWSDKKAYALFAEAQVREPLRFSGWTKSLILRTAMAIARASGSINRSEAARISELQELLGRSV
jgi:tellurite resistance protein